MERGGVLARAAPDAPRCDIVNHHVPAVPARPPKPRPADMREERREEKREGRREERREGKREERREGRREERREERREDGRGEVMCPSTTNPPNACPQPRISASRPSAPTAW